MQYPAASVAAVLLGVAVVVWFAWRRASRRRSLPCPASLRWLVELENPFARAARSTVVAEHLALRPGMSVLDLGCGPGRVTIAVARRVGAGGDVLAVDMQAGMIERAQRKARDAGLDNVRFLQARAGAGRLGRECLDRALMVAVLGEIPDRAAAVAGSIQGPAARCCPLRYRVGVRSALSASR